ncbi:putative methionyl-tRNA synthetase [Hordeum vulgare]|nr:putative methionyl-tRNA synthetase [Hordeum vulgare]
MNTNTYWGRIKTTFDECKLVDPDFANIHMDRGQKAMANRWSTIQMACNKWHGIIEEVAARPKSGANVECQMIRMFAMYHADNEDQEFRFLHAFSRIESCEKWREVRLALDKAKETYNPDAPAPLVAEGCPDGTKNARAARDAARTAERLQASVEQCITDAKSNVAKREEKSNTRWSALMANQHVNLNLRKTNVAAKKRNTDLTTHSNLLHLAPNSTSDLWQACLAWETSFSAHVPQLQHAPERQSIPHPSLTPLHDASKAPRRLRDAWLPCPGCAREL